MLVNVDVNVNVQFEVNEVEEMEADQSAGEEE